jgi:hypothetical protein
MPIAKFPFITDGIRGRVPVNMYPAADSERETILQPSPGLSELCSLPFCTEIRGLLSWNGYLYCVAQRGSQSVLWRIEENGTYVELGIITTSAYGPVWMVNNSTQICVVDGVWGWVYNFVTGLWTQIADVDFPGASSVDYQDGYGIFSYPNSDQWFFSDLDNFTSFDALNYYSASSSPDNVVSVLCDHREPWIFKQSTHEIWRHVGGDNLSIENPTFERNPGGMNPYGCGAAKSPTRFDNTVAWLSDQGQLLSAVGYNVNIITNEMFGRAIAGFTDFSDAIFFSYIDKDHQFLQMTFPLAGQTWVYDAKTKIFHEKTSYIEEGGWGRHRANCYALLNNIHYVGDYRNGKIYKMSINYYDDNGEKIQRIVHTKEVDGGLKRISFPDFQIITESGVGLESGLDPQVMLDFSADGGKTWTSCGWQSAGKIGEYWQIPTWRHMGGGYKRMYRATMTDPVLWRILGVSY